jgi:hypothetical protein
VHPIVAATLVDHENEGNSDDNSNDHRYDNNYHHLYNLRVIAVVLLAGQDTGTAVLIRVVRAVGVAITDLLLWQTQIVAAEQAVVHFFRP